MNAGRGHPALINYGGSGLSGVMGDVGGERGVGVGVGRGLSSEQPVLFRNRLSLAEASLD